jgi:hypothetical protein
MRRRPRRVSVERPTGRPLSGERAEFLSVQAWLGISVAQHRCEKVDPSNGNRPNPVHADA